MKCALPAALALAFMASAAATSLVSTAQAQTPETTGIAVAPDILQYRPFDDFLKQTGASVEHNPALAPAAMNMAIAALARVQKKSAELEQVWRNGNGTSELHSTRFELSLTESHILHLIGLAGKQSPSLAQQASDILKPLLTNNFAPLRMDAAEELGNVGAAQHTLAKPFFDAVRPLIDDREEDVRFSAMMSLFSLADANDDALDWLDSDMRRKMTVIADGILRSIRSSDDPERRANAGQWEQLEDRLNPEYP